jgi:hypothetical protein
MPIFERPKTLFGKYSYFSEQRKLFKFVDFLSRGVGAIDMALIGMIGIPSEWIPEHMRRDRAMRHLKRAKEMLLDIGVI